MKNIIKKFPQTVAVLAAIAAIFLFFGSREGTVPPSQKSSSAGGTDLNGQWSLKFWPQPDTGALRTLGEAKNAQEAKTIKAQVPGNVELDLFRAGLVPNPELGDNSYKLREYEGYQWLFSREFASPKLESGERAFTRRSSVTDRGVFAAMFGHEFKEIVRTRVFAYFYLGVAVATPVMVFFCDRLVSDVGAAQLGEGVNFGASMLVIAAFMALINAFSAASLSREGEKFFITKLIPVPYRTQLLIKGLVNLIVSAGALVISVVVIVSLGFVTAAEAAVIAAAGLLLSCGFVLNGLNLNLANPSIRVRSDGGFNEANVTLMMVIGLFLSAAVGIAAIVLPFFIAEWLAYLVAAAVALLYAGANFVVFWFTAQKKYAAVEC